MPSAGKSPTTRPLEASTLPSDPFEEVLARVARGEVVARPELVILASEVVIEEPVDLVEWAKMLAADLAHFED